MVIYSIYMVQTILLLSLLRRFQPIQLEQLIGDLVGAFESQGIPN